MATWIKVVVVDVVKRVGIYFERKIENFGDWADVLLDVKGKKRS